LYQTSELLLFPDLFRDLLAKQADPGIPANQQAGIRGLLAQFGIYLIASVGGQSQVFDFQNNENACQRLGRLRASR